MDKAALIQQVLSLTPEQIAALPPAEQGQIILLRQQLMTGGGF
jgi:cleavage stimulation factor subunit 2